MFHPDLRLKPKDWRGEAFSWAEVKYDGWRMTLFVDHDGSRRLVGRKPEIDRLDDVSALTREKMMRVPVGTVLDGELFVPGEKATFVPSALKTGDDRMVFAPFAVPYFGGQDVRRAGRYFVHEAIARMGFQSPTVLNDIPRSCRPETLQRLAREMNAEGFVLKQEHYRGWYRVKRSYTVDLIVCGWTPGKGKHEGRIGSVDATTWEHFSAGDGASVATVGGISDELRERSFDDTWRGRVIEVEYDEVGAGGRLKFARFVRFRDDKPREECVL